MNRSRQVFRLEMAPLAVALLLGLSPAVATAQSVRGNGVFPDPSHGAKDGATIFRKSASTPGLMTMVSRTATSAG